MKPLCFDIFTGIHGWAEGFVAEGWRVIGFDLCDMRKEIGLPPIKGDFQLVLQDVLTLHGAQFQNADCIVASPPCTEYSFMAMPWKRGKRIAAALRGEGDFPDGYTGSRTIGQLNTLFNACFRIQREACEAAGRYSPMVVENVKGAQPWVGKARANYGSYYLWGDVDSIGGRIVRRGEVRFGVEAIKGAARKLPGNNSPVLWRDREVQRLTDASRKVNGLNFHEHEKTGKGRSFQSTAVKVASEDGGWRTDIGKGARFTSRDCGIEGVKFGGGWWHDATNNLIRKASSKSPARKAASAEIAKIPFPLVRHIAACFKPQEAR